MNELNTLVASMQPELQPGVYVFASVSDDDLLLGGPGIIATFREREGTTVVIEENAARLANLVPRFRAAWITLNVESDLAMIGFTSAFARVLSDEGISCNVIAAVHHDHIFVPHGDGERAMNTLLAFQKSAGMLAAIPQTRNDKNGNAG